MIGKPEWFTYRIFGWGLRPRTWQGFVYILVLISLFGIATVLPIGETARQVIFWSIFGFVIIDTMHIMTQLAKVHDERENLQQLIIERNVSYAAIFSIIGIALYQAYQNRGLAEAIPFDYSLALVLGVMLIAKVLSTLYVSRKM